MASFGIGGEKRGEEVASGDLIEQMDLAGSGESIKQINEALTLFTFELPDAKEDLSVQSRTLQKFTLFPYLPFEIRLMIWRAILPRGQLLKLIRECFWLTQKVDRGAPQLPISLQINRESRTETLKHYKVICFSELPTDSCDEEDTKRTLCFSPERDFIYLAHASENNGYVWLTEVFPDLFDGISELTIRLAGYKMLTECVGGINLYKNLKTLNLIQADEIFSIDNSVQDTLWHDGNWPEDASETRTTILDSLEKIKADEDGGMVPDIRIMSRQKVTPAIWSRK
ncbi:hypothetical protein ONS96_006356 [Cadophora gregata f. sp. sojae]|nr:hypothetical protein ONS96_006356 [Cadophora gregata f. sp. sojae]